MKCFGSPVCPGLLFSIHRYSYLQQLCVLQGLIVIWVSPYFTVSLPMPGLQLECLSTCLRVFCFDPIFPFERLYSCP
ncbi:unnamed protein product [Periconia digitata]|uniref:Uncharacterized protein n=1 Tax=Periconia digitata TaxID=1303443 RepID=A0A9W4XKE3_9PLEO|nr:unnamed protein product [Periconia digitata]